AATALHAAQRGYAVCVNFRARQDAADAVVRAIYSGGGRATAVKAENHVESDVRRLFDTAERELGPIAALVNNAGVPGRTARVEGPDVEEIQRLRHAH